MNVWLITDFVVLEHGERLRTDYTDRWGRRFFIFADKDGRQTRMIVRKPNGELTQHSGRTLKRLAWGQKKK